MNNTPYALFGLECGKGWAELYTPVIDACKSAGVDIFQIKEKFGALRIYVDYPQDASNVVYDHIQGLIEQAELDSTRVCETCGSPDGAQKTRGGWIFTLCQPCFDQETRSREAWLSSGAEA